MGPGAQGLALPQDQGQPLAQGQLQPQGQHPVIPQGTAPLAYGEAGEPANPYQGEGAANPYQGEGAANPYQAPAAAQGPPMGYGQPMGRRPLGMPDPPSYLAHSILVTLFCCQVFGIVAIVFAALTISANGSGNWEAAEAHSAKAKLFIWIGVVTGLLFSLLYFMFVLSGGKGGCGAAP